MNKDLAIKLLEAALAELKAPESTPPQHYWTPAQREAHSRRMKAMWARKKSRKA